MQQMFHEHAYNVLANAPKQLLWLISKMELVENEDMLFV